MAYNIELIRKDQHKTSEWSGGTTTELCIYPKNAIYSERNFKWRLSSAKVEVEESTFTPLQGISRIIMIVEGELRLEHQEHHTAQLKAFEQDTFSGDWTSKSFGKVTDFNLMMTGECSGNLEVITLESEKFKNILLHNHRDDKETSFKNTEAFYLVKGKLEIITEAYKKIHLNVGDLALITRKDKGDASALRFWNCADEEVKIIRASIFY